MEQTRSWSRFGHGGHRGLSCCDVVFLSVFNINVSTFSTGFYLCLWLGSVQSFSFMSRFIHDVNASVVCTCYHWPCVLWISICFSFGQRVRHLSVLFVSGPQDVEPVLMSIMRDREFHVWVHFFSFCLFRQCVRYLSVLCVSGTLDFEPVLISIMRDREFRVCGHVLTCVCKCAMVVWIFRLFWSSLTSCPRFS